MRSVSQRAGGISLQQLFPESYFFGGAPDQVTACCGDSRHCKPGDLFAAILGRDHDGHDFASEAVKQGAAAVLAERPLPVGVPTCIVEDSRTAYGRVCQALAGDPSGDMGVIGVTGSHGKTTTALLIAAILEADSQGVGLLTSLGYCDGHDVVTDVTTTPTSPQLARWLASAQQNGCQHAIVEASSVGLAQHRMAGVALDAAVLTNIRRAHLDLHGSVINYRRIKQRILSHLKPEGFAVVNADDPASKFFLSNVNHPLITFGMQSQAEVTAELLEMFPNEQTILLTAGSETVPVRTTLIGQQHIYNCLAAAATGLVLGIDLPTVVQGIESLKHIPGRMEHLPAEVPFNTFVDQGQTADTLAASLKSLRRVTSRRLICVYGAAGAGDPGERPLLGRTVERLADVGIITRNNPRDEEPLQIAQDILDGYDRPAQAHLLPDRAKAIGEALNNAQPGDTVLIAGRGNENEETIGCQRVHFDDREVARYFLDKLVDPSPAQRKIA